MSRNGPPRIAGFCRAETCICGEATKDSISLMWALATSIADEAGESRYDQAYHWLKRGSISALGLR
jgi:hypothetical protein